MDGARRHIEALDALGGSRQPLTCGRPAGGPETLPAATEVKVRPISCWMTSGVGPRDVLPEAMRRTSLALLLTHVATALRDPWISRGSISPGW